MVALDLADLALADDKIEHRAAIARALGRAGRGARDDRRADDAPEQLEVVRDSACATAAPVLSVETLTRPSLIAIPSGSLAGMLRLVDSPPLACTRATRPSVPETAAASARAGACAGAAEASAAAATATMTAVARSRVRT